MEKLNAMSEWDMYYQWSQLEKELKLKKEQANEKRKLFEPHLDPKELSKL